MSKLYGTLVGDRGESTRCSNKSISAVAQSLEGSITVSIDIINGEHFARIDAREGSGFGGQTLWRGKLSEIIGKALVVKEGE